MTRVRSYARPTPRGSQTSRRPLLIAFSIGALLMAQAAAAYRQVRIGPIEVSPSLALEIRQHSNVFLTNDDQNDTSNFANVSGFIVDLRPGLNLTVRPGLEKKIRGFYLDLRYAPTIALFPAAPTIELPDTADSNLAGTAPDRLKIDQNLNLGFRYQSSGRLSISGGAAYSQPELSQTNFQLSALDFMGGAKYDFSRTMSLEGSIDYNQFATPESDTEDSALGSFDELRYGFEFFWRPQPTTTIGASFSRGERIFDPVRQDDIVEERQNDFNGDSIADSSKDYSDQSVQLSLSKRLTRQVTGTVHGGYIWRTSAERQFGASDYNRAIGGMSLETLLTKRTRLQATAELVLTDTIRKISLPELNAFTGDQIGQFSVIPEQFAAARSQRILVDIIQNVFRRGDQILLGVAYQKDQLLDQQGTQNFFRPAEVIDADPELGDKRLLDETQCEVPGTTIDPQSGASQGALFCRTILNDQEQRLLLFTAGYRLRLLKWLGLQVRGAYYKGETQQLKQFESTLGDGDPVRASYWSLSGGLVFNLSVFK